MINMHEYHDRHRWTTPYLTMSRQDDMIWCEDALHLILTIRVDRRTQPR